MTRILQIAGRPLGECSLNPRCWMPSHSPKLNTAFTFSRVRLRGMYSGNARFRRAPTGLQRRQHGGPSTWIRSSCVHCASIVSKFPLGPIDGSIPTRLSCGDSKTFRAQSCVLTTRSPHIVWRQTRNTKLQARLTRSAQRNRSLPTRSISVRLRDMSRGRVTL